LPDVPTDAIEILPGGAAMQLFFHRTEYFDVNQLLFFGVSNYFLACWTYGLGVPSGLFVPSLLTGACWGRLFGRFVLEHANFIPFYDSGPSHAGLFAVVGAVSFLAGTARITISLAVIIMECTGSLALGLPLFVATVCAKRMGDKFGHGIYDMHIVEMKRIPLLEYHPDPKLLMMSVTDAMNRCVVSLEQVETVERLLQVLDTCNHHGFPVLYPGTKHLAGMIGRHEIHMLLNAGEDYSTLQPSAGLLKREAPLVPYEARWERRFRHLEYPRREQEMHMRVDLAPYVDRNGYVISETASMHSCFELFRQLGLRHLPVIDRAGCVCGMITRKDLILIEEEGDSDDDDDASTNPTTRRLLQA
jgi:predicted transcriptional regulator